MDPGAIESLLKFADDTTSTIPPARARPGLLIKQSAVTMEAVKANVASAMVNAR
jgi:hypothetical protein